MGNFPLVLRVGDPQSADTVLGLVRESARWLCVSKNTDQWQRLWPDRVGHRERALSDLLQRKTWLVWDGRTAVATITVDPDGPLDLNGRPVWPADNGWQRALYARRVIVDRSNAGLGLGAALLDWAAQIARENYGAGLIRVDVWTTNWGLHAYFEGQGFIRCQATGPRELIDYPSQALFERAVNRSAVGYTTLLTTEEAMASVDSSAEAADFPAF